MTHEELMRKAKDAKNAEEILALAKENGVELTEERAEAYFQQLRKNGELSDDELDNVAGGGCHISQGGYLVVTLANGCQYWRCWSCGGKDMRETSPGIYKHDCGNGGRTVLCTCAHCKFLGISQGGSICVCGHEANRKK